MPADREEQFDALLAYLKRARGIDLTGYKPVSVMRRLEKRMHTVQVQDYAQYMDHLEVHPEEFAQLLDTILINVTGFFRDPTAWELLARDVIPKLLEGKKADEPIRIWTAGCASGQETYSVAMLLAEAMGKDAYCHRVKLYASEVDEQALTAARQGTYEEKDLQDVRPEWQETYFEKNGSSRTFRTDLRRTIIFGRHNLVDDSPISRLDLLICRNVLMYFNAEVQNRILARFHFALNDTGYLFLGRAEMLLTHANLFTPLDLKHRIFTKVTKGNLRDRLLVLGHAGDEEAGTRVTRQVLVRDAAFDMAPVAQIVLDIEGNMVQANERARTMFSLAAKDVGRPFRDLELSYRPAELRSLVEQAYAQRRMVTKSNVERRFQDMAQYLDIELVPIQDNGNTFLGMSITFQDVSRYHRLQDDLQRMRQELETAYEELQSTNEELETTNEELQSTVEELETTNEELQSTNEELETMNEELQSTNEELQAVNAELRDRTEEVNRVNAYLQSILAGVRAGVVALDEQLNVTAWNHKAEDLWGMRSGEVKGRAFFGLDIGLPVRDLLGIVRDSMDGGGDQNHEKAVEAINRRGKRFTCRVQCSPLKDAQGTRRGTILLMEEQEMGADR
jgi:two-component system CheB/CheR fusion protein